MLPCALNCPHYCEGCHKSCPQWNSYVQRTQEAHHAKLDWLRRQNQESREAIRTYRAISPCRSYY